MAARILCWLFAFTVCASVTAQDVPRVRLEPVLKGFSNPVYLCHDGVNSDRIYVVEQRGTVRLVLNGEIQPTPYLDIVRDVQSGGECGLLSIAFAPDFAESGLLYANYTSKRPKLQTVIEEFKVDPKSTTGTLDGRRVILTIDQPFANHNGGHVLFGPDGMLYIGMGDGGAANDPHNNAQNPQSLLGKILRISVGGREPYTVPGDNPFLSDQRYAREIWATGLRNPWRMCFDPESNVMITGDVGQNLWEEVAMVKPGDNHGWRPREGMHPNPNIRDREDPLTEDTDPIVEYEHKTYRHEGHGRAMVDNCIIGGYVYRGPTIPSLQGWYLYADYNSGRIWAMKQRSGKLISNEMILETTTHPSSFGEDLEGEMYVCDHQSGVILQVVAD